MGQEVANLRTWDVLRNFGFEIDPEVIDDNEPGLSYDFGDFKLTVLFALSMRFQRVAHFGGIWATPRTIANVEFELPQRVASPEQCAALLAFFLDRYAPNGRFQPIRDSPWLEWGRQYEALLPWRIEAERQAQAQKKFRERYNARAHCRVDRRFLRLALNILRERLAEFSDDEQVVVSFDGRLLRLHLGVQPIDIAADGVAWQGHFTTTAANLRELPGRLQGVQVEVGIWESRLQMGNRAFPGSYSGGEPGNAESL